MEDILSRLARIEAMLTTLIERQAVREWYNTEQFAVLAKKAEFTVREWCRLGRIRAEKSRTQSGGANLWTISHDEFLRYQREGLLPMRRG